MQETLNNILKAIDVAASKAQDKGKYSPEDMEQLSKSALMLAQAYKALKDSSRNDDKKQHSPS